MKKICSILSLICLMVCSVLLSGFNSWSVAFADSSKKYFTVYDEKKNVLFLKGDDVSVGDNYLSSDNKLYEIISVDENGKTAKAKFLSDEMKVSNCDEAGKDNKLPFVYVIVKWQESKIYIYAEDLEDNSYSLRLDGMYEDLVTVLKEEQSINISTIFANTKLSF